MGLHTLAGFITGTSAEAAVLYCSTTMRALPFMFRSAEDADDFVAVHAALGDFRSLPFVEQQRLFEAWEEEWKTDPDGERHPRAVRELTDDDSCPDPDCPFPEGECKDPNKVYARSGG